MICNEFDAAVGPPGCGPEMVGVTGPVPPVTAKDVRGGTVMALPGSTARSAYLASALILALGVAFGLLAMRQLRETSEQLETVVSRHAEAVIQVARLQASAEALGRATRSYLVSSEPSTLAEARDADGDFSRRVDEVRALLQRSAAARAALESAADLERRYAALAEAAVATSPSGELSVRVATFDREAQPVGRQLREGLSKLARTEMEEYLDFRRSTSADASRGARVLLALAILSLASAAALTFVTVRVVVLLGRTRRVAELANQRLLLVNRDLDAFAGRTAHDLRNVLAPVKLLAARLGSRAADASAAVDAAERLNRVAIRSERLIASLLALARGAAPVDPAARSSVRVVLGEVLDDLAEQKSAVGAEVRVEAQDVMVACTPGLLHVVLTNLVGNALKFLTGCPTREVNVTAASEGAECRIAVADTGPGIPAEWRDRVFRPFVRAPGSLADGFGIGLATVQRIVHACGGRIDLRSEVALGTTIVVHLPAARAVDGRSSAIVS